MKQRTDHFALSEEKIKFWNEKPCEYCINEEKSENEFPCNECKWNSN